MGEIEIRRATLADVDGFVASSAALFAEDAGGRDEGVDLTWPLTYGAQRFTDTVGDADRLVLVAVKAGTVVGHLSAQLSEGTVARPVRVAVLRSMFVFPEYRRAGVGTRMVRMFRAWARENEMDRVEVTTYATNQDALRFYQREGFVVLSLLLETVP